MRALRKALRNLSERPGRDGAEAYRAQPDEEQLWRLDQELLRRFALAAEPPPTRKALEW